MVLRERNINYKNDEVRLYCSFSLPDVKALFRIYAERVENIRDIPFTESDYRYWFEHNGRAFLSWPEKWREQLSGWAVAVAIRHKLLIRSAADENKYYLADFLFTKRGRPPKK